MVLLTDVAFYGSKSSIWHNLKGWEQWLHILSKKYWKYIGTMLKLLHTKQCLSLGPCSGHIPSPSLPLLAPRILILALLNFHLSASGVEFMSMLSQACTDFFAHPEFVCPSLWAQNKCQLLFHPREQAIVSSTHKAKIPSLGGHKSLGGSGYPAGVCWG